MSSSAWQNFWPDLSGLGAAEANGRDARARLLKINAEMFVAAPSRNREAVETFEALALGFLPTIDSETLAEIAPILAPCPDTPDSVRAYLLVHSPRSRDAVIGRSRQVAKDASHRMFGTWEGRMALAAGSGIGAETAGQLLVLEEDAVDDTLAANCHFAAWEVCFAALLDRGRRRTALARILLSRDDIAAYDKAALYLAAPPERRAGIRERLAEAIGHQRANLSFNLTPDDMDLLLRASREGDAKAIEAFFNTAFGFPGGTDWRLLRIDRHHLLALALKALGVATRDAARIFTALHPALAQPLSTLKNLIRTMRETDSGVALALVEAILDVRALSTRN